MLRATILSTFCWSMFCAISLALLTDFSRWEANDVLMQWVAFTVLGVGPMAIGMRLWHRAISKEAEQDLRECDYIIFRKYPAFSSPQLWFNSARTPELQGVIASKDTRLYRSIDSLDNLDLLPVKSGTDWRHALLILFVAQLPSVIGVFAQLGFIQVLLVVEGWAVSYYTIADSEEQKLPSRSEILLTCGSVVVMLSLVALMPNARGAGRMPIAAIAIMVIGYGHYRLCRRLIRIMSRAFAHWETDETSEQ